MSLGIAYLHRAMQRQSDNRHHQIAQGLACLKLYRDHRGPCQEVEYNLGRAFHYLSARWLFRTGADRSDIHHHAILHYERVLDLAAAEREPVFETDEPAPPSPADFSREAAYNLSQLFLTLGWSDRARALSQRWLSF